MVRLLLLASLFSWTVLVTGVSGQAQPGDLLQVVPFAGTQPIDLCHVPGTNDLYVVDGSDGNTYRYDLTNLAAGSNLTIPNPGNGSATTGVTSDGAFLYWAITGTAQNFWRTDLLGGNPTALGNFALPEQGNLVGLCMDADGNLWANDVSNDLYSMHSLADGSFLNVAFPHPNGSGSGSGIAFRPDCEFFEIPHGPTSSGRVTSLTTVLGPDGATINSIDVLSIGSLVRGVEAVLNGSTGAYSVFLVEGSTNQVYEILGSPACPLPEIPEMMDIVRCSQPAPPPLAVDGILVPGTATDAQITFDPTATFAVGDLDLTLQLSLSAPAPLTITLETPGGVSLILHEAATPSQLNVIFDDEGIPYTSAALGSGLRMRPAGGLLSSANGELFAGTWTISISSPSPLPAITVVNASLVGTPPPGLPIAPVGAPVIDTITVTEASTTLRDLNVSVEIPHPFVADLLVSLTAPTGTTVVLHDQSIDNGPGIFATYDDDGFGAIPDGPGLLEDFNKVSPNGTWTLTTLDSFAGDEGSLNGWCLHLDEYSTREVCHEPPRAEECTNPAAPISDLTPVTDIFATTHTGLIRDLDVGIDLQHTWIGDLDLTLESPAGTSISLMNAGAGDFDNILTTFDDEGSFFTPIFIADNGQMRPQGPGTLADFDGELIDGSWTLSIVDSTSTDDGVLNSWCLDTQTPLPLSSALGVIEIPLELTEDIVVEEAELRLSIEHPASGELLITLQSPTGTEITLLAPSVDSSAGVDVVFAADGVPFDGTQLAAGLRMQAFDSGLANFTGESMLGTWTLLVADTVGGNDGELLAACLSLSGDDLPCVPVTIATAVDATAGPAPLVASFSSTLGGSGPFNLVWDFGDGGVAFGPSPTHFYATAGIYQVTTTATNECGTATSSLTVEVCDPITATAEASILVGPPPLTVDFTSMITGGAPLSLLWDFGDGTTSTAINPSKTFTTEGDFPVTLTVTNNCETVTRDLLVSACFPAAATPTVSIESVEPSVAQFTAGPTGSAPISINWDFGDGTSSTEENPLKTYDTPGSFVATLTVTNACGTDVQLLPVEFCTPVSQAATASTTSGTLPLAVDFATNVTGTAPLSVLWEFGDGATSTDLNPSHLYTTDGNFTASVTVTNDCGTSSNSFEISVCDPVAAAPTATPPSGSSPLTVDFAANATGSGPITASWIFGDGGISTELNPTHTFATDGTYNVLLTVSNLCGSETMLVPVTVCDAVVLDPTASTLTGLAPLTVDFNTGESGTAPISTAWFFGDGSLPALGAQVTHTFTEPGIYSVTASSTNLCGNAQETLEVRVCDPLTANPLATGGASATIVDFTAQANGTGPLTFLWDFGDGNTSTEENPSHDYGAPGTFTVTFTVSDPCGSTTLTVPVDLCTTPTAAFTTASTFGIAPYCATFTSTSTGSIATTTWDFGDGTVGTDGAHTYAQPGDFDVSLTVANECGVEDTATQTQLVRVLAPGDVNADGTRDITDPIAMLGIIFAGDAPPVCFRTADVNADNFVDIADAVYLLFWQFGTGPAPLAPECGSCDF